MAGWGCQRLERAAPPPPPRLHFHREGGPCGLSTSPPLTLSFRPRRCLSVCSVRRPTLVLGFVGRANRGNIPPTRGMDQALCGQQPRLIGQDGALLGRTRLVYPHTQLSCAKPQSGGLGT